MRNIEYVCGGIAAIHNMCSEEKNRNWKQLFEDWNETLYSTLDLIEEDYEGCQKPLKNLQ